MFFLHVKDILIYLYAPFTLYFQYSRLTQILDLKQQYLNVIKSVFFHRNASYKLNERQEK